MTTPTRPRAQQPSRRPAGWLPAGHVMPVQLAVRQDHYCRCAVGVVRFTYYLCVATHQFRRINRMPWLSWKDLNKAVNQAKRHHIPFLAEASDRVVDGAVRDFGTGLSNWRGTDFKARRPTFHKKLLTRTGNFHAAGTISRTRR